MSRTAISAFVIFTILVAGGGKAFAQHCGANAKVGAITMKPNGQPFYWCVCLPGYVGTAPGLVVSGKAGQLHTPGCVRPRQAVAKKELIPVDPENRFGNATIHRKLQYVTQDSPHFDPGALSIDKNRKKKRGLKPIDLNERVQ